MGTRSNIAYEDLDGKIVATYCHWDGYPTGVGETLIHHYNKTTKAEEIANQGYLSSLRATLDGSLKDRVHKDAPLIFPSLSTYSNSLVDNCACIEYVYVYKNNQWHVAEADSWNFVPLWSVLLRQEVLA